MVPYENKLPVPTFSGKTAKHPKKKQVISCFFSSWCARPSWWTIRRMARRNESDPAVYVFHALGCCGNILISLPRQEFGAKMPTQQKQFPSFAIQRRSELNRFVPSFVFGEEVLAHIRNMDHFYKNS